MGSQSPSPLFSVIIPTFNPGAKLTATLQSVQAQNADYEILVLDGGSNDGTVDILRDLAVAAPDACFRWWSEPDKGVWDGFNKGIERAQGHYLYFLPAGDRLRPHVLAQVAQALPDHERGFVYGRVFLEEHGIERERELSPAQVVCRNMPHQGVFYGRDIFKLFGLYDLRYPVYAEHPINIRCFADPRIEVKYLDLVIADFEGFGLSSTRRDPALQRVLPLLAFRSLGWRVALRAAFYWWVFPPRLKRATYLALCAVLKRVGVDFDNRTRRTSG